MNKKQRKILEFLSTKDASDFITQDEISSNTKIKQPELGTECRNLWEIGFLDQNNNVPPIRYRINARGQIQLSTEKDKKITSTATIALAIATIALAIGTIILAMNSVSQTSLMQHDFDVNNRPYLGVVNIEEYQKDKAWFIFTNYGKIPNTDSEIRVGIGSKLSKMDLYNETNPSFTGGVVLPTQSKSQILLPLTESMLEDAKSGKYLLYVGILIKYNYAGGNEGEYGVISVYDNNTGSFDLQENWIK